MPCGVCSPSFFDYIDKLEFVSITTALSHWQL